jgi:uncharacterized glyoxalase superfamily protein PhnB
MFSLTDAMVLNFNRSVPVETVLPHVMYRDIDEAITWLSRAFGFLEHYRYGTDPVSGAQMRTGNAFVMIKRAEPQIALPDQLGYRTHILTIFLDGVEECYERAKAAGARILEEPHETIYGEFQYAALDLAGHQWVFSRHARDLDPVQWGATVAQPVTAAAQIAPQLSVLDVKAPANSFQAARKGSSALNNLVGAVAAELSVGQG